MQKFLFSNDPVPAHYWCKMEVVWMIPSGDTDTASLESLMCTVCWALGSSPKGKQTTSVQTLTFPFHEFLCQFNINNLLQISNIWSDHLCPTAACLSAIKNKESGMQPPNLWKNVTNPSKQFLLIMKLQKCKKMKWYGTGNKIFHCKIL